MFRFGYIAVLGLVVGASAARAEPALSRAELDRSGALEGAAGPSSARDDLGLGLSLTHPIVGRPDASGVAVRLFDEGTGPRLASPRVDGLEDGSAAAHVDRIPSAMELHRQGDLRILLDRLDRRVVAYLPRRRVRVGIPQLYRGVGPMDFMLVVRGGF